MLMRLRARVAVVSVVTAVVLGAGAGQAVAASSAAAAAHTTTVLEQGAVRDDRSPAITVLLVGVGAAVGVIVGVIPALAAAMLLGYVPAPRRAPRAGGVLVEPLADDLPELPEIRPLPAAPPELVALDAAADPSPDPELRPGQLAILAHARHQDVYDTAYAQQLERVGALRSAIGDRRRTPPEPSNEPSAGHPAKGTP